MTLNISRPWLRVFPLGQVPSQLQLQGSASIHDPAWAQASKSVKFRRRSWSWWLEHHAVFTQQPHELWIVVSLSLSILEQETIHECFMNGKNVCRNQQDEGKKS
jgi:hypothetical protein